MFEKYFRNVLSVFILVTGLVLFNTGYATQSETQQTIKQNANSIYLQNEKNTAELWRAVKRGATGVSTNDSLDSEQLINVHKIEVAGNEYSVTLLGQKIKTEYMPWALGIAFAGVFGVFLLFYFVNGASKLSHGFSGRMILRWSTLDRIIHWVLAISCILLIFTGMIISMGKHLLAPHMGSAWDSFIFFSKLIHDYSGPVFVVFWALCVLKWSYKQIPHLYDLKWFLVVGGYINFPPFKGKHPDSGFANAGEKLWFWSLALFGFTISVTGIIMVLPQLEVPRYISMLSLVIHGVSAVIIIAFSIVHIWMATVLSEGGMDCMISGYCDENWATQHHNLWYDELEEKGKIVYLEDYSNLPPSEGLIAYKEHRAHKAH